MRIGVVLALAAAAARTLAAQCPDGTPPPCRAPAAPPARSIAVLDFVNLSRDSTDAYLSEGLADELATRLGQVARLTVTSRAAVRRLRSATTMALPSIGRALNAAYLLNGSYSRSGVRMRFTVELLRAASGRQVWASQYDRSERDLLAIQGDIATAVATAVVGRLLPAERTSLSARPTADTAAYDAYLRGRALLGALLPSQQAEAAADFERAVARDSTFAAAWAALARVYAGMYWFYVDRSSGRLAAARAAADRAAALAPDAADTHIARGYVFYWAERDYGRALQEFSAALVSRPNDAEVHSALANVARRQGSWEQSLESRTRALELDPENKPERSERGLTFHVLRRFDEAARDYELAVTPPAEASIGHIFIAALAVERDGSLDRAGSHVDVIAASPEDYAEQSFHDPGALLPVWRVPGPLQTAILASRPGPRADARALHYLVRGQVLASLRRPDAGAAFDSVRAIVEPLSAARPDDDGYHAELALAYAGLGRCEDALHESARAVELLPVSRDALTGPQRLQEQAEVEATCGRLDQAIDHLAALLAMPSFVTPALLRADPAYAPLRDSPRFRQLLSSR